MNYKKLNLANIKDIMFEQEFKKIPYIKNFKKNPYTYLKARYYLYSSVLIVYVLLKSRVTANMVSITYILCGIVGGSLLSIPNLYCNIAGVIIFFNKGILDWTDGALARFKYGPTLTGHILDCYGAYVNSIGFAVGLGFFALHQTGIEFLVYPIATIAFLYGGSYTSIGKDVILNDLEKIKIKNFIINHNIKSNIKNNNHIKRNKNLFEGSIDYPKWITFFRDFLDERARSVDFILLVIIIDIYFNYTFTFYLFLIFYMRILIRFFLSFYFSVKSKWAESTAINIKIINNGKK